MSFEEENLLFSSKIMGIAYPAQLLHAAVYFILYCEKEFSPQT